MFDFIPHYLHLLGFEFFDHVLDLPVDLPRPAKMFGMIGGIGLLIGGALLIFRHWTNRDDVGANTYTDYLFLYVIFLASLTGMLTWMARLTGIPMLAYVNYFIHLVFVFFLLVYMPYSKFAHMLYRTLALVYCKSIGREAKKPA